MFPSACTSTCRAHAAPALTRLSRAFRSAQAFQQLTREFQGALLEEPGASPPPCTLISVGDSEYERQAAQRCGNDTWGVKAIKLMEEPTCEHLRLQLGAITQHLRDVVATQLAVDWDVASMPDPQLGAPWREVDCAERWQVGEEQDSGVQLVGGEEGGDEQDDGEDHDENGEGEEGDKDEGAQERGVGSGLDALGDLGEGEGAGEGWLSHLA